MQPAREGRGLWTPSRSSISGSATNSRKPISPNLHTVSCTTGPSEWLSRTLIQTMMLSFYPSSLVVSNLNASNGQELRVTAEKTIREVGTILTAELFVRFRDLVHAAVEEHERERDLSD